MQNNGKVEYERIVKSLVDIVINDNPNDDFKIKVNRDALQFLITTNYGYDTLESIFVVIKNDNSCVIVQDYKTEDDWIGQREITYKDLINIINKYK